MKNRLFLHVQPTNDRVELCSIGQALLVFYAEISWDCWMKLCGVIFGKAEIKVGGMFAY